MTTYKINNIVELKNPLRVDGIIYVASYFCMLIYGENKRLGK